MSNPCLNYISITTSVNPFLFLSHPINVETGRPDCEKITFVLNENIFPSEDPKRPWENLHGTDSFEITEPVAVSEPSTTKAPPAPTPIIITQWKRRYAVKQKPDFVPRTSRVITIVWESAWAPPLWYLNHLYKILKRDDDQIEMWCYFVEHGMELSGAWYNWSVSYDDYPPMYYSPTLGKYIIQQLSSIPARWSLVEDIDLLYEEQEMALAELSSMNDPVADEEIIAITNYFQENQS